LVKPLPNLNQIKLKPKQFAVHKPMKGLFHYADYASLKQSAAQPLGGLGAFAIGSEQWQTAKSKVVA
jgi:hypothetical protein